MLYMKGHEQGLADVDDLKHLKSSLLTFRSLMANYLDLEKFQTRGVFVAKQSVSLGARGHYLRPLRVLHASRSESGELGIERNQAGGMWRVIHSRIVHLNRLLSLFQDDDGSGVQDALLGVYSSRTQPACHRAACPRQYPVRGALRRPVVSSSLLWHVISESVLTSSPASVVNFSHIQACALL